MAIRPSPATLPADLPLVEPTTNQVSNSASVRRAIRYRSHFDTETESNERAGVPFRFDRLLISRNVKRETGPVKFAIGVFETEIAQAKGIEAQKELENLRPARHHHKGIFDGKPTVEPKCINLNYAGSPRGDLGTDHLQSAIPRPYSTSSGVIIMIMVKGSGVGVRTMEMIAIARNASRH